ncbi:tRNA (guanine(26)-N(2))-dimethyltransferase-like protein [Euroglyphus maynei]|uniref:tRNA (guanine(26)-N(2))-dimethyltransferase n=1 Tax=Euroglyphus maynei TaxID=6958 RepID=A0A1Y3BJ55_EURMA|nr:tRNA (guanine(26)-N(2))-dimethyltransferase-like protein [Euroglyphus maynei]
MDQNNDETIINEGKARIHCRKQVFYNKVQEFNRDLSVLAVHTYLKNELWKSTSTSTKNYVKERVSILDALSATGLRSIRYSLECKQCPLPVEIIANDISDEAINMIESNIELNDTYNIIVTNEDASMLMYKKKALNERITVIDLDPYGSPTQFLDSAIQNIVDGGLLMVTSTDMAVLCGNHGNACFAKYGSYPLRGKFCHEMALRIICASVNSHAARYGRHALPLLSLSIDFYARIFFRVFTSKNEAQKSMQKMSYIYLCKGCESFHLQPLCEIKDGNEKNLVPATVECDKTCSICGHSYRIGGPIWSSSIHDKQFIRKLQDELNELNDSNTNKFGTYRRMEGMLQLVSEELDDCPLYYHLDRLCSIVCCPMPSMKTFRSILINGGYQFSLSHAFKNTMKTNAPIEFIWAMIQFIAKKFRTSKQPKLSSYIQNIMDKNFNFEINDSLVGDVSEPLSKSKHLLRYQLNPEQYWGPKSRPTKKLDKNGDGDGKKNPKRTNNDADSDEICLNKSMKVE